MENNFNLKKFLVENRLTANSRLLEGTGTDYLKKAHQAFYDSDPDETVNPADVMYYIGSEETDEVDETQLLDKLEEKGYKLVDVAEFQYEKDSYNFLTHMGASEYESSIVIQQIKDSRGTLIPYKGYDYLGTTDRGSLTGTLVLLDKQHVDILKSIADIFDVNTGDYAKAFSKVNRT